MKFLWKGKLTSETAFTYPDLPNDAKPLIKDGRAWLMYLLVVPLLAFAYLAIQFRLRTFDGILFTRPALFVGIGLALLFLPIHEWIHAAACPAGSIVFVYMTAAGISMVPTCKIGKDRYVVMALMPAVLSGILPFILWMFLPVMSTVVSSVLFSFSVGSLSMCIGDIYNVILALLKMPKGSVLVTSGTNCYFFRD